MYMAPEILSCSKEKGYKGFPVDIWSAGIALYIMLSGTLPFSIKNDIDSFDIKNTVAPQIYPSDKVLDSDARYREDKQWLKLSWDNKEFGKTFEGYGQCWKLALEAQQRYERGLRKEYKEHKNKKKK